MAVKQFEQGTSNLPLDIIEIILSNLSVKPLLRFKTVCKSWNTMISHPLFIEKHLHQSKTSNSQNLFLCHSGWNCCIEEFSLVKIEDGGIRTAQALLKGPPGFPWILCNCDGVLLLTDNEINSMRYVLWNPSTRTRTMFRFPYKRDSLYMYFGLCRDPRIDDFKVVVICSSYYAVYSCKNKAWTRNEEFGNTFIVISSGIFVDGVVYWFCEANDGVHKLEIACFDPKDDKIKMLQMMPKIFVDHKCYYMTELKGRLCVYSVEEGDHSAIQIWTKEKGIENNDWKELITIENVETPMPINPPRCRPLCFVDNKIIFPLRGSKRFAVYNPSEKSFQEFEDETHYFSYESAPYLDSLISPNTNSGV